MKKFYTDIEALCGLTVVGTTSLSTATGVTVATSDNSTKLATTAFVKSVVSGYVPTTRTITINGTTYDLSANRSWTISTADGYVSNVVLNGSLLEFTGVGSAFSGSVDLSSITPIVRTVYETVKNTSGATILKGTPLAVVAGQTSGNVSDVVPADASDPTKMPAVFIANQNIADQAEGEAILFGYLQGVNTSAYTSGTTVYVAAGGGWTATKPVWPNKIQNLGVITKQHATNGAGIVTGVGRANDLPNLTAGKIWVGTANYPIESTTVHIDEANTRMGVGTSSIEGGLHINYSAANTLLMQRISPDSGPPEAIGRKARGTVSAKTGVLSGDRLWFFAAAGYYGTEGIDGAWSANKVGMNFVASETWTPSAQGTHITWATTAAGQTTRTDKMILTGTGDLGIGTATPAYKLDVAGTISNNSTQNFIYASYDAVAALFQRVGTYGSVIQIGRSGVSNSTTVDYPADGTFAVSTAGSERMRITSAGNVGIGTTAPDTPLSSARGIVINSGASNDVQIRMQNNTTGSTGSDGGLLSISGAQMYLWNYEASNLIFGTSNSERMRIDSSGNLGVGITSPSYKLDVFGGFNAVTSGVNITYDNGILYHGNYYQITSGNNYLLYARGGGALLLGSDDVERVRIASNGNVGIGTTSPSQKFVVSNGSVEVFKVYSTGEIVADINYIYAAYSAGTSFYSQGPASFRGGIYNDAGTYLTINGGTSNNTYFNGNVGIGTTSPESKLHVAGGDVLISNGQYYGVESTTGGNYKIAGLTTGNLIVVGAIDYTSAGTIFAGGDNVSFTTGGVGGSTRIKIASSGNVGIGVDPVSGDKFEVAGTLRVHTGNNWDGIQIYSGGQDGYIRGLGDEIGLHIRSEYGNVFIADDRGKVAIGTTATPQKKLDVNGSGIVASFGAAFGAGDFAGIHFGYSETIYGNDSYKKSALVFERTDNHGQGGNASGKIHFLLNNLSGNSATNLTHSVFTIDTDAVATQGSARVGIGTSSPQEAVHAKGNIRIDGSSTAAILETGDRPAATSGSVFETYDIATTYGAFVDYIIYDTNRDNMRNGTFRATWNLGQAVYTDTSTVDIGDTSSVVLTAVIDGANVKLIVTGDPQYTIKYNVKLIK